MVQLYFYAIILKTHIIYFRICLVARHKSVQKYKCKQLQGDFNCNNINAFALWAMPTLQL